MVKNYNGLGIGVFRGFSAVDIDHCIDENGKLSDMAQKIVKLFKGCYIEKSPSGTGLCIIFMATGFKHDTAKYYINNQKIGLEVYVFGSTNKFVTVTGNVFQAGDISYLKDTDKYTGDGKITQVKEWDASGENSMWTVYYNDATFDSVESYVADLVAAGCTNHYADEDGNYMEDTTDKGTARAYYCTSDYAQVEIQVADFSNSMSFTDKAEFSFNLKIEFSKS